MPTNRYVESSFWNFDSLFQPQSHPARDAHDTFFLTRTWLYSLVRGFIAKCLLMQRHFAEPANCLTVPEDYYKRVEDMHENGGFGSIG